MIKKNNKWLNISYESFWASIKNIVDSNKVPLLLIQKIYPTILDTAFNHRGGLISVVFDYAKLKKGDVINNFDILYNDGNLISNQFAEEEKTHSKEEQKRINKKAIILNLLNGNRKFYRIDRRLRSE